MLVAGTGVCSLALAQRADEVMALDISSGSPNTLRWLYQETGLCNVRFVRGSLLSLPLADASVNLVWSWGVIPPHPGSAHSPDGTAAGATAM